MSDYPEGPGWWQASDQKWYPPESFPSDAPAQQPAPATPPAFGQPPAAAQPAAMPPGQGIPPAPGAAGYAGAPGYPGMVAQQKNNGLATGSMVVSIISVLCMPPIGLVGAIMGHVALGQINKSGGTQGGKGMAMAGIIIGWIAVALFVLAVIVIVAGDGFEYTIE